MNLAFGVNSLNALRQDLHLRLPKSTIKRGQLPVHIADAYIIKVYERQMTDGTAG
jgi:hypothetical protein